MFRPCLIALLIVESSLSACASAPGNPAAGQVWKDPLSGLEFCYCPPGTFLMGTPEEGPYQIVDQTPRHSVTLTRGFWLGRTEVSLPQWKAWMGKLPPTGEIPAEAWRGEGALTMVSWEDCQRFLQKLNQRAGAEQYRLPTEAEWEYACEAGTPAVEDRAQGTIGKALKYGDPKNLTRPNAWGLITMLGPIREWCSDWDGPYPAGPVTDPQGPGSGRYKVNRGGYGYRDSQISPTYRWFYTPDFRDNDLGFRVVRVAP